MAIRDHVEGLCRFEHRGSATENERQAAEYIKDEMTSLGLEARLERFVSHTSFSWVFLIIYGGSFAAGLIGWRRQCGEAGRVQACGSPHICDGGPRHAGPGEPWVQSHGPDGARRVGRYPTLALAERHH